MKELENVRVPWSGWTIVAQIGEGGYGIVYRIERTQSGVTDCAALKVIRIPKNENEYKQILKDAGSPEKAKAHIKKQKDKVIKEIKNLQMFKGTGNIVTIEDWAIEKLDDGYSWELFIRMELLTSLDKVIEEGGFPSEDEVIKIGKDICNALRLCEKENIIHRDVKQGNILVTKYGDYKLSDFGISRNLDNITTVTGVGAKPYMAPEVAKYEKTGKTVDTYSLGVVMYELLNNNRLPFIDPKEDFTQLDKGRAIQRRLDGERIPDPANGCEELKKIVLKACEFDPKDRFKSAEDMYNALSALISGTELVKEPIAPTAEPVEEEPFEENPRQIVAKYASEYNKLQKELDEIIGKKFAYLKKDVIHQEDFEESNKYDDEFNSVLEEMKNLREKATALIDGDSNVDEFTSEEKKLFGAISDDDKLETTKKIDRFYTLYRKNEEFQKILDKEYSRLKGEHINYHDDISDAFSYISEDNNDSPFIQRLREDQAKRISDSNLVSDEENNETAKKVAKFYRLQRENEEFQKILDEEYNRLSTLPPYEYEETEDLNNRVTEFIDDEDLREEITENSDLDNIITENEYGNKPSAKPKKKQSGIVTLCIIVIIAASGTILAYFNGLILQPDWGKRYSDFLKKFNNNPNDYIDKFVEYYEDPHCAYYLNDVNKDGTPELFITVPSYHKKDMEDDATFMVFTAENNNDLGVALIGEVELIDPSQSLIITGVPESIDHKAFTYEELLDADEWNILKYKQPITMSFSQFAVSNAQTIDNEEFYDINGDRSYDFDSYFTWNKKGIRNYIKKHRGDERKKSKADPVSQAYLQILKSNRSKIKAYSWQNDRANNPDVVEPDEEQRRCVVIDDVNGDEVPELMFMSEAEDHHAYLHIYTYDGEEAKECSYSIHDYPGAEDGKYADKMVQGGTYYIIYKGNAENTMYVRTWLGSVRGIIISSIKIDFDSDNCNVKKINTITSLQTENESERGYYLNGVKLRDAEGQSLFDDADNDYNRLLMSSAGSIVYTDSDVKLFNTAMKDTPKAMTYEEAIRYLSTDEKDRDTSKTSTDKKTKESTKAEDFAGKYSNGRASVEISNIDNEKMRVHILWGSSAWEYSEWTFIGYFDSEKVELNYDDCKKITHYSSEDSKEEQIIEGYTSGSGMLAFKKDGSDTSFVWNDYEENAGHDQIFEKYE